MGYIAWIRSKLGHDKIFLNFAAGILCRDSKILLQKRSDKQLWGLPGGALELGESALEALKREFWEETGLSIIPVSLQNVYTKYEDSYPNGDIAQTITCVYVIDAEDIDLIYEFRSEETLELRFFSYEEIGHLELANKQHRDAIDDFFWGVQSLER